MTAATKPSLAIGADHAGFALKEELKKALDELGSSYEDLGTHDEASTDYPDFAHAMARGIHEGRFERGILVCGTGVGMSMAVNKHSGLRAVVCSDTFSARMARLHNDANVLCIGSRVVGSGLASDLVREFLETEFEGGRHARRVAKIDPD